MGPRDRSLLARATLVPALLAGALLGVLLGVLPGCAEAAPFTCSNDQACDLETGGRCEADGHCSYPDDTCPLGRRYRDAADGAPCVGGDATESGSGSTNTTAGTGTDSDTGTYSDTGTDSSSDAGSGSISSGGASS